MLITVNLQSRNIRSEKIDRHWSTTKVKKSVEVKMDRATRLKLREQRITYESFATVGEIRVWWRADFKVVLEC